MEDLRCSIKPKHLQECGPIMCTWPLDWIDICLKLFTIANYIDCQFHVSKSKLACKMFMRSNPSENEGCLSLCIITLVLPIVFIMEPQMMFTF